MKAGVTGNSIDVIAREILVDSGYPEYPYALGHQLGRVAHDGGALLGPLVGEIWRLTQSGTGSGTGLYDRTRPGCAKLWLRWLEEDVVMTENGAEYIGEPQREIMLIKG